MNSHQQQSELIINFTPTGMVPTKKITPHVPISASEIVESVHQAVELGITMVHLHARDEITGEPTYKAEIYGKIIAGIRAFSKDLVICVSLSGRNFNEFEKRSQPLELDGDLKPDMGSLTLTSLNFMHQASINTPEMVQKLAMTMKQRGIVPELEVFDLGMINYARYLERKGYIEAPYYFNVLLGNIASAQATALHVGMLINELPTDSVWSLGGIGDTQLPMNAIAIAAGGGVRVGLEDNIWLDSERTRLASNSALIRRVHELADIHQRPVMSSKMLRQRLNLPRASFNQQTEPKELLLSVRS